MVVRVRPCSHALHGNTLPGCSASAITVGHLLVICWSSTSHFSNSSPPSRLFSIATKATIAPVLRRCVWTPTIRAAISCYVTITSGRTSRRKSHRSFGVRVAIEIRLDLFVRRKDAARGSAIRVSFVFSKIDRHAGNFSDDVGVAVALPPREFRRRSSYRPRRGDSSSRIGHPSPGGGSARLFPTP